MSINIVSYKTLYVCILILLVLDKKKQLGDLHNNKNSRRKSISSIASFCEDDCNKG